MEPEQEFTIQDHILAENSAIAAYAAAPIADFLGTARSPNPWIALTSWV